MLDFTSQLTACSPQGSQPTEEDDAICNSKELKYSSPRWQLAGCKITSAGRTMQPDPFTTHAEFIDGFYTYPGTGVVMAGKVVDYLLELADMQASLIERKVGQSNRPVDNNHWVELRDDRNLFEFQFQVPASSQHEVSLVISKQLKVFVRDAINAFDPTEILIYSTSCGGTLRDYVDQEFGPRFGLPDP